MDAGGSTVGRYPSMSETTGRTAGSRIYLTYAGTRGHAMIDRELYLPRCWTDDPDRLTDAGVPDDIDFATNPPWPPGCWPTNPCVLRDRTYR
jgi:hypothetical protein